MNQQQTTERIAIVGWGRLARAIWRTFPANIALVLARHPVMTEESPRMGALGDIHTRLASEGVTAVWIATSDSAIPEVVNLLASSSLDLSGVVVLHSSGATPVSVLDPLLKRGALTVALHPNGAFTGAEPIPAGLFWGLSSPNLDVAAERMGRMLAPLDPQVLSIPDTARPLYHAAASVAANGSVALFALAERFYRTVGFDTQTARRLVAGYMRQAAERCEHDGPERSLTGPIVRGDREVVERQRDAVAAALPEELVGLQSVFLLVESLARRVGYQSGESNSSSAD